MTTTWPPCDVALACEWEGDHRQALGELLWLILSPGCDVAALLTVWPEVMA